MQLLFGSRTMKMLHNIPHSGKYTMALLVMSVLGLIGAMGVMGTAMMSAKQATTTETAGPLMELLEMPHAVRDCVPNYADCMNLEFYKPCCRQEQLEAGQVVPEDFICFRFGEGMCQPLSSVGKLEKYAQLVKFANMNNVVELIGQYHDDNSFPEQTTTDLELDHIPIERDDGLTLPDGFTPNPDSVPIDGNDGLPTDAL